MSSAIDRKITRDALVAQLRPALTVAQVVEGHKANVKGQWPAVFLLTSGSLRPQVTEAGIRSEFYYLAQLWVLYYHEGLWTEAEAEDALDALEHQLAEWLANHQVGELWTALMFEGRSRVGIVVEGGETFLVEEIPIRVEVYG